MKNTKKLTIGISLVVLLAVATTPVQAALKVSNSYSSSGSNGSIISLRSYTPFANNTATATPITPTNPSNNTSTQPANTNPVNTNPANTSPVNTSPVNTTTNYESVISLKDFKFAQTQPAPAQTAPTQPTPTQPTPTVTPATPSTTGTTTVNTQEQTMINEINKERAAAGLAPVKIDLRLVEVAQLKANDMKTHGYFSHTSPIYGSPFDMLRNAGIQYRSAGENIARNRSVDFAMAAFMSSDGHRRNILNPAYTHVGVGVVSSSSGNYYVQIFAQL